MQLLLLHGLAGAPEDWCATLAHLSGVQALTPRIDYLSMDEGGLPGLAASLRDSLPSWFVPEQAVVAGNSLGGALALLSCVTFRRIVLVAPHLQTMHGRLDRGVQTVRRELERIFHAPEHLHRIQVREYERLWARASGTRPQVARLRHLKRRVASFDVERHLSWRASSVTLVCGREDLLTPVCRLEELKRRHPEVYLHVVEGCGHAVPLERPGVLAGLLQEAWQDGVENYPEQAKVTDREKNACQWCTKRIRGCLRNTSRERRGLTSFSEERRLQVSWGG